MLLIGVVGAFAYVCGSLTDHVVVAMLESLITRTFYGFKVAATPKNEDVNPATLTTWSTGGNVQDASRPCIW